MAVRRFVVFVRWKRRLPQQPLRFFSVAPNARPPQRGEVEGPGGGAHWLLLLRGGGASRRKFGAQQIDLSEQRPHVAVRLVRIR